MLLVAILVLAGAIWWRYYAQTDSVSNRFEEPLISLASMQSENASIEDVVAAHGQTYDGYCPSLNTSTEAKWNKNLINGAYFCMLYADIIGLDGAAGQRADDILAAKVEGVNIGENAANMSDNEVESIRDNSQESINTIYEDLGEDPSE